MPNLQAKFALLAALVLGSGCAATLQVMVPEPAPTNLGAATRLSVVQTEGRRSAREELIAELINQTRSRGHFQTTDRTEEGITMKIAGRAAEIIGAKRETAQDEILVRFDVLEWGADRETKTSTDSKGNEVKKSVYNGKVLIGLTAASFDGRAFLAEKEYEGRFQAKSEGEAIRASAFLAIAEFLREVTPTLRQQAIRLDEDDAAQKPIIKVARAGNLSLATEEMQAYLAKNPTNPVAKYNLAVLLDAAGDYAKAIELYSEAIAGSNKEFYVESKSACARRLANQQALSNI